MDESLTEIVVVVDRSGSMEEVRQDAIGGLNAFLAEQREAPGRALLTLVLFHDEVEVVHSRRPVGQVPPLDRATFVPRGGTALLDAWGGAMEATERAIDGLAEAERPGRVLFAVLTDGEENASRVFDAERVRVLLTRLRGERGWTFLFLAADERSLAEARSLGVPPDRAAAFEPSRGGTGGAFRWISSTTSSLRSAAARIPLLPLEGPGGEGGRPKPRARKQRRAAPRAKKGGSGRG